MHHHAPNYCRENKTGFLSMGKLFLNHFWNKVVIQLLQKRMPFDDIRVFFPGGANLNMSVLPPYLILVSLRPVKRPRLIENLGKRLRLL
jgi:hypothetical protein